MATNTPRIPILLADVFGGLWPFYQGSQRFKNSTLIYPPMQKITIVGNDSSAKNALIISLSPTFEIVDLSPGQIQNHLGRIKTSKGVILIGEEPDQQIVDRLHGITKILVVITRHDSTPNVNDLFISITKFQNSTAKGILKEIRSIKAFIEQSQLSTPKLNEVQHKVFWELGKIIDLSDPKNWDSLHLSRSKYFSILEQLRMLFDVEKNWQLIQLAKNMPFT